MVTCVLELVDDVNHEKPPYSLKAFFHMLTTVRCQTGHFDDNEVDVISFKI